MRKLLRSLLPVGIALVLTSSPAYSKPAQEAQLSGLVATDTGWAYCEGGRCVPLEEWERKQSGDVEREYVFPKQELQKVGFNVLIPDLSQFGAVQQALSILGKFSTLQKFVEAYNKIWSSVVKKYPKLQGIPVGQILAAAQGAANTLNNYAQQIEQFYQNTILPYVSKINDIYNTYVDLTEFTKKCYYLFMHPEFSKQYARQLKQCKKIVNGDAWTALYVEAAKTFNLPVEQARKKLEKSSKQVKKIAQSVANQPFEKLNGKQVEAQVKLQESITEKALATPQDVPLDPQVLKNKLKTLPTQGLKDKYLALANLALTRKLYSQMVVEKVVTYSQQILALKKAIDDFCSKDFSTPVPSCSMLGGGSSSLPIRWEGGVPQYYSLAPEFEKIGVGKGWVKNFVKHYVDNVAMNIISQIIQVGQMVSGTVAQVGQGQINSLAMAACTINQRIALEANTTRTMEKTMFCLLLRLQLAQMQLLIDNYDAGTTVARAMMKQLTVETAKQIAAEEALLRKKGLNIPRK